MLCVFIIIKHFSYQRGNKNFSNLTKKNYQNFLSGYNCNNKMLYYPPWTRFNLFAVDVANFNNACIVLYRTCAHGGELVQDGITIVS